jgi:hypothetical protein
MIILVGMNQSSVDNTRLEVLDCLHVEFSSSFLVRNDQCPRMHL